MFSYKFLIIFSILISTLNSQQVTLKNTCGTVGDALPTKMNSCTDDKTVSAAGNMCCYISANFVTNANSMATTAGVTNAVYSCSSNFMKVSLILAVISLFLF